MGFVSAWDVSTGVFFLAFMAHGVRDGWCQEPRARWWQKAVNVKSREWTWVDWALLAGFFVSVVMAEGWSILST